MQQSDRLLEQLYTLANRAPNERIRLEIARAALFLASPLSRFMTGTVLHVDGGSHAAGGWFPRESGGWTNRPRNP